MVDAKRAVEVLELMVEGLSITDFHYADLTEKDAADAIAALKAQGEPVYQCCAFGAGGAWTECPKTEFDKINRWISAGDRIWRTRILYTAPQPESQPAQAVPDGIQRFLKNAFITCETSGFDKCYVVVFKFPTLAEAQDLHRYIVTLPAPAQGGQV